ncbi:MAG: tRNA pseudouridine(55) synthase TruB, partial [Pirellulaceae bacterium]|nr:tRNA pseudouridine(55) synthase TruB [Pirellulaceae bacterium]
MRSGLLVINKPAGISSRECVNRVQRAAHDRRLKVGHAGTLDPLATGVLLIAIGEATRLVEQLHELDKRYVAQFQFGKSSDTLDRDGEIEVHENLSSPNRLELDAACQRWVGPAIAQRPPRYSAIKIQGQRAYDLARRGQEFDPEARPVAIHALQVLSFAYPDWSLDIHCGSGTYVRSIGRDVAADLHNVAIMTELVRTAIGPFTIQDACPLDDLRQPNDIESRLCSPLAGLPNWHQAL